mgnify:CR=1 FL=1
MNKPKTTVNPTKVIINVDSGLSFAEVNATLFGPRKAKGYKVTLAEFISANEEILSAADLKRLENLADRDKDRDWKIIDGGTSGYSVITVSKRL